MMIPKASIWDGIQAEALEVISEGTRKDLLGALDFYNWRDKGGYHVTGITKKDILVMCSATEYGEVIAKEVSMLMDQALEHRMLLDEAFKSGKSPSNSWLLVTTYYWCVFLCLAWLRLVGKVVTYLPKDDIDRLKAIYGKEEKGPVNGTFVIIPEEVTGTKRLLRYRKLNANNFHEGLWCAFAADIKERLAAARNDPASMETRLFIALNLENFREGSSWPSKLRNMVNYRIGFGYGAVEGRVFPNLLLNGPALKAKSMDVLIQDFENIMAATNFVSVKKRPDDFSHLLLVFGSILTHVLEDHCSTIWTARSIDKDWSRRRKKYLSEFDRTIVGLWPN